MYQPIDQGTMILARLTELSTPSARFSITWDPDGYWAIAVGEVRYLTSHITVEALFNAYLMICAERARRDRLSGAV